MAKATTINLAGTVVPLNERITYQAPEQDIIQPAAVEKIRTTLNNWARDYNEDLRQKQQIKWEEWHKVRPLDWDKEPQVGKQAVYFSHSNVEWVWEVKKNPANRPTGTLPKRISKWYFEYCGVSMPKDLVAKIGVMASESRIKASEKYVFQFTDRLVWHRGDFGDPSSCWFGTHTIARPLLRGRDGVAVQFFDPESGAGLSRCWLIPAFPMKDAFIIFNGYGLESFEGQPLNKISTILSDYLNLNKQRVGVRNENKDTNLFYLNGDAYAFAIGETFSKIRDVEKGSYNLDIERVYTCETCGDKLFDDDDVWRDNNWMAYCDEHANHDTMVTLSEKRHICHHCNERYDDDNMREAPDGRWWCDDCFGNNWSMCEHCDDYYSNDNDESRVVYSFYKVGSRFSTYGETERREANYWCESCVDNDAIYCDECQEWYYDDDHVTTENNTYCRRCAPDHAQMCDACEEWHDAGDVNYIEDAEQDMCSDCYDEWLSEQENVKRDAELIEIRARAQAEAERLNMILPLSSVPREELAERLMRVWNNRETTNETR